MLKKTFKLNTKQYKSVFEKGKEQRFSFFLVKWFDETNDSRFGFGFSSRLKLAPTRRNYLKRRLYAYLKTKEEHVDMRKWVVFMVMKEVTKENIASIYKEIDEIIIYLTHETNSA